MKKPAGKELFRCDYSYKKDGKIQTGYHQKRSKILIGIYLILLSSMIIVIIFSTPDIITLNFNRYSLYLIPCIIGTILFLLSLIDLLSNYMIIYDTGILMRKTNFPSFLKRIFIPFDLIEDVEFEDFHLRKLGAYYAPNLPWLIIYIKNHLPYVLRTTSLPGYKEILRLIKQHKKPTKINKNYLFIAKYYRRSGRSYHETPIPIKLIGKGTQKNPFTIDETQKQPRQIHLLNYDYHTDFSKITSKIIYLDKCQNFIFEGLDLKHIKLHKCEKITLKNCTIKKMEDYSSKNNIYDSNFINKLKSSVMEKSFKSRNTLSSNSINKSIYRVKKKRPY